MAASHIPQQPNVIFSISLIREIEKHYFSIYLRKTRNGAIKIENRVPRIRHTYATMLYDAGVDVLTAQRLLGHADVQTTMRVYTHLSAQKEQQSIAALNAHIGAGIASIKC